MLKIFALCCLCLFTLSLPAWAQWSSFEQIEHKIATWSQHEEVKTEYFGYSHQKRKLWVVSIGSTHPNREVLWICGQHSDERESIQTCVSLIDDILQRLQESSAWRQALKETRFHFIPVLNPDGLILTQRYNAVGVDLNRNWGTHWGEGIKAEDKLHQGQRASSEPETQALQYWILTHTRLVSVIDYHMGTHDFAQGLILYPFTYAKQDALTVSQKRQLLPLVKRHATLMSLGDPTRDPFVGTPAYLIAQVVRDSLQKHIPEKYWPMVLPQLPTETHSPGSLIDWVYQVRGIPALGFEVYFPSYTEDAEQSRFENFQRLYLRQKPILLALVASLF